MGCPVILTSQSLADLESIVRYVAKESPERAQALGNKLIDKALVAGRFPESGRMVPELGDAAVREAIHGTCRIIYETRGNPKAVYVLRFWHGARGAPEVSKSG